MRNLKELLELLLVEHSSNSCQGLCATLNILLNTYQISSGEHFVLFRYLHANKPSAHLHPEHYEKGRDNPLWFWWTVNDSLENIKIPRIKFLNHLISIQ